MSHQDRKSPQQIVVNHQVLREVIAWLFPPALFVGMHVRQGSTWKPRMLAAAALFWATSDRPTLGERFEHARKIIRKIFHRLPAPGKTCEGFLKRLRRWNGELLVVVVGVLRARMEQELADQFQVAGFTVFAGDGSRVETPRTQLDQRAFSPRRKPKRNTNKRAKRGTPTKKPSCPAQKNEETFLCSEREEGKLVFNLAVSVVVRRKGIAVVMEPWCCGFERTSAPVGDAGRDAGKLFNYGRCGLCGVRILEGGPRRRP